MKKNRQSDFIIFKTQDEKVSVDVRFEEETVWLTQDQMVVLFDKAKSTISEHIKHIFEEGELEENSVVRKFRTTATDGKNYEVNYYNLDVIISVGYRVKSLRGTQFRQWATKRLNEYKKYQQNTLSEAEKNYLESLKFIEQKAKNKK